MKKIKDGYKRLLREIFKNEFSPHFGTYKHRETNKWGKWNEKEDRFIEEIL